MAWLNLVWLCFMRAPTVAEQKSVEQVTIMNARNQGVTLYLDASTPPAGEEKLFLA